MTMMMLWLRQHISDDDDDDDEVDMISWYTDTLQLFYRNSVCSRRWYSPVAR